MFLARKYVKIFPTSEGVPTFIALIRKDRTRSNFVLIDENWEIDSLTKRLYETM